MIETYEDLLDAITEVSDIETAQLFHKYTTESAKDCTAKEFFDTICNGMLIPNNRPKARVIRGAFLFDETPEGSDFWFDIANKVKDKNND